MELRITDRFTKNLKRMDKPRRDAIQKAITLLLDNPPASVSAHKEDGRAQWYIRVRPYDVHPDDIPL